MEEDYDDNYSDGGSEGSLSEASDGADDQFAEVDASLVTARRSFACVNAADLKTLRDADVQQVAETLSCSASDAGVLLRAHGWNREKVISAYFENPEGVLDKSGVCGSAALRVNARADAPFRCPVCLDARTAYTALGCGHMVCTECFREYVVHKIDDEGPAVLRARCPGVSCPLVLTPELVLAVAPQDKSGKFLAYWDQSYVDDNPHFEWCPGPSCGRVLRLLQPPDALVPGAVAVACNCGQRFCFRCRQDDHSPASCEQLSKWLEKCKDDSETYNWLQANTRTCPECKTAIEKNGGCNHMVCKKCAFEWCWVCSGPWKEHSGNYYNCNRFKGSDDEESRRKDQSKAALERYLHYYTRYFNHHNSLKLEEKTRAETEKKIDEMQQLGTNTWLDVQYLKDGTDALLKGRHALQYTYVYAFFLQPSNHKELFEMAQSDLEYTTEQLSRELEKPVDQISRMEVIQLEQMSHKRLKNLFSAVEAHHAALLNAGSESAPGAGQTASQQQA